MDQIAAREILDNEEKLDTLNNIEDTKIYKKLKKIGLSHNFIIKYFEDYNSGSGFNSKNGIPESFPPEEYEYNQDTLSKNLNRNVDGEMEFDIDDIDDLNDDDIEYLRNKIKNNETNNTNTNNRNNTNNLKDLINKKLNNPLTSEENLERESDLFNANNIEDETFNNESTDTQSDVDTESDIDTDTDTDTDTDSVKEDGSKKEKSNKKNKIRDYTTFRRFLLYDRIIKVADMGRYTIVEAIAFTVNCLIFPAILFQMGKTWSIKKNEGFTPWFILLQLLGGAPEGGVGAIIGHLEENSQMLAIGLYAMFYNAFMLFFRIFGTTGYYPLFKEKPNL